MRAHSRKLLWLSVWVTSFAVAMACLLLVFKHRAALDGLQRDRLERVADDIDATVTRSLAIGIPFADIAVLPDVLDSQKNTEALVVGIDVVDADGRVLYSTDRARVRGDTGEAWRSAIARSKERQWHATDGDLAAVGGALRNSFGLVLGHVVVRYSLANLDKSNREFALHLARWGAAIAAASTLLVFLMLSWAQGVVERRLARARAALQTDPQRSTRPGSLTGEASAARLAIEAAHRELDAVDPSARGAAT